MRSRPKSAFFPIIGGRRSGYTLVEILVAMTLTLILMTAVVTVFGGVGNGIAQARRAMEQNDRLRTAVQQLRMDLLGVTAVPDGRPGRPEEAKGYFEHIKASILPSPQAINGATNTPDCTVGLGANAGHARSDILTFTTRNAARPFVGRYQLSADSNNPTMQSDVAEVAWFVRGTTLHRRVLLVSPGVAQNANFATLQRSTYYANNDISARLVNGKLVPNSLGDLTKRENRFAHPVDMFPFDVRRWDLLGLPTLYECSSATWMAKWVNGTTPLPPSPTATTMPKLPSFPTVGVDLWDSANVAIAFGLSSGTASPDQYLAQDNSGTRLADDVILTNVIGFDVKVWDPGAPVRSYTDPTTNQTSVVKPGDSRYAQAVTNRSPIVSYGAYVDLGWRVYDPRYPNANIDPKVPPAPAPGFWDYGNSRSGLVGNVQVGNAQYPCIYDTYCFSYENEGIYNFNSSGNPVPLKPNEYPKGLGPWPAGTSTNGLADDPNSGVVDGTNELITQPPYPVPLRGIQIKVRCFEPDSRQVREITIEHDFLPK